MQKGYFVIFEGPNGVGKTTIINAVCDQLHREDIFFVRTKEPTKSELGVYIRENQNRYSKEVLACLVAANRYEHLETVVHQRSIPEKLSYVIGISRQHLSISSWMAWSFRLLMD